MAPTTAPVPKWRAAAQFAGQILSALRGAITSKATPASLSPPDGYGSGWWPIIYESRPGAWQADIEVRRDLVLAQSTVFACLTLIAADVGKLRLKLVQQTASGIWDEIQSPAFSPVLRKPNRYQTRQKFIEQWIVSKLSCGNTAVLKQRDQRGVVVALYVLDWSRCQPLVAPDGSVYYQLLDDDLSGIPTTLPAVPASEIIHDRMICLFHPLIGISPIFACGLAGTQALKIQQNSAKFFENMSRPSGILTAPGQISDETAARLKAHWENNFTGDKIGKVAVLGDALEYKPMATNPVDAQLVEQLNLSSKQICAAFHVPPWKVGLEQIPAGQKVADLNQIYYADCLQSLIESIESLLDEGLGLTEVAGKTLGTEIDLDDLLRMDMFTLTGALKEQVVNGIAKPDEARRRLNLAPVPGGDTPYLQQQNYSLAALAKRDARDDPFHTGPAPAAAPAPAEEPPEPEDDDAGEAERSFMSIIRAVSARLDMEEIGG